MEGKTSVLLVFLVALPFFVTSAPNGRIFGGNDAKPGQFPYMVSLQFYGEHYCGGSILSNRTILTAAHCLMYDPMDFEVFVGSTTLDGVGARYKLNGYALHPSWDPRNIAYDTGVVYLDKDLEFSSLVQPIAIDSEFIGEGHHVTVSGWGTTQDVSEPNNLQYLTINTVTNEYCQSIMDHLNITVHYSFICAESPMGQGTCFGDSGSPLVKDGQQIGITSWGIACALKAPDAFSRISLDYDWLKSVTK